MVKDFLYSSIYSRSTQFFNLCVSWSINGWNAEKRDGARYFNEIVKPICICLREVGNSQYLNVLMYFQIITHFFVTIIQFYEKLIQTYLV